jgi:tetratricopeptide (TPR) repeat protein
MRYSVLNSKSCCDLRAPLRNRTVDLLLTMNPRQVPSPQVDRADLAKHEPTRALASSRQALTSTVLTLNLTLTLILLQRSNDRRNCTSKMGAIESGALAEANRDAYLPELAAALTNHAVRLSTADRPAEAAAASEEALAFYRELAGSDSALYLLGLARCLTARGFVLIRAKRFQTAVRPLAEALILADALKGQDEATGMTTIARLLRTSYAEEPAGVSDEFRAATGQDVPPWMTVPPDAR